MFPSTFTFLLHKNKILYQEKFLLAGDCRLLTHEGHLEVSAFSDLGFRQEGSSVSGVTQQGPFRSALRSQNKGRERKGDPESKMKELTFLCGLVIILVYEPFPEN